MRKGYFNRERFWSFVQKSDSCWLWIGRKTHNGYGQYGLKYVHRISYELVHGPIPEGLTIDHLCRVRNCINPSHMEPISMRDNILRGTAPTAVNAKKTHCIHGHPFSKENTLIRKDRPGTRTCLECFREFQRIAARGRYRREHPGAKIRKA